MTDPTPAAAEPTTPTDATNDDAAVQADVATTESSSAADVQSSDDIESSDGVAVDGAMATDGVYTVVVADFADTEAAIEAYDALRDAADGKTLKIEGVLVVKRDEDGTVQVQKVTDPSTRRGVAWGAVGGLVFGVLFPPSALASAVVGGIGGAVVGELRKRHHKAEIAEGLDDVLQAGHSGIIALVSDPAAERVAKALAKANAIVSESIDKSTADEIKAAALAEADDN